MSVSLPPFTFTNVSRDRTKIPYEEVKNAILGKQYQASVTLQGAVRGKKLNQESRNKDYVPNVLSFPLTDDSGEVYLTPSVAKAEAKKFGHSKQKHMLYLYIHGLLHLKGYDHGPEMEKLEAKYLKQFTAKK